MNLENALLHLKQDQQLRSIIEIVPVPVVNPSQELYFDLLNSIVSQQLSTKVARVIFSRFCALFPDNYPAPELLAAFEPQQLRPAGLSGQKSSYLRNVALFFLERNLEKQHWEGLSDEEIISYLTQIKGVGTWTVQMLLMFTLNRPDILPVDDLGIQQAMKKLFSLPETGPALRKRMLEVAEPWRPYRTLASRYLWRWKDSVE